MAGTEDLIATLAASAPPVKTAPHPVALFAKWIMLSLVYGALLLAFLGVRDDLSAKLHDALFISELALLACVMMTTAFAATLLSFPDLHQKRIAVWTPLLPLLLFVGLLIIEWQQDKPPSPLPVHGIECLICIVACSLLPAMGMFYMLRKQASTHYSMAGAVALLASFSVGALVLRLSEKTDSAMHLIEWHYLPMIGFGLIGVWLGRKCLKW